MPPQTNPNKSITSTPPTSNIDPKTGIPFGAKGTKDFYVDATGNWVKSAAYTGANSPSPIVTSTPVKKEFTDLGNDLSDIKFQSQTQTTAKQPLPTYGSFSDDYTKQLDALGAKSGASTKALISSIQAQRSMRANEINNLSDNYKRGLQLLGIQSNQAQSTPELLLGRIQEAENARMTKIQNLDIEENKAILDAEEAQSKNQVGILKEKLDYIRQLRKDKQDEIKAIADESRQHLAQVKDEVALMGDYATQIISQISGLKGPAKSAAIQAIADKFGVSAEAVVLAASGYSQTKADKAKSGSAGGGYTPQETRKLRQAGIDPTNTNAADNFLYGENKGEAPAKFNKESISDGSLDKNEVWKLALALGIPRKKNLSKNNEINQLLSDPTLSSYVQDMLDQGYTIQEIIDAQ